MEPRFAPKVEAEREDICRSGDTLGLLVFYLAASNTSAER